MTFVALLSGGITYWFLTAEFLHYRHMDEPRIKFVRHMALYHKDKIEKFDTEARNDCIEIFRLNMERDDRHALFMNKMLRNGVYRYLYIQLFWKIFCRGISSIINAKSLAMLFGWKGTAVF